MRYNLAVKLCRKGDEKTGALAKEVRGRGQGGWGEGAGLSISARISGFYSVIFMCLMPDCSLILNESIPLHFQNVYYRLQNHIMNELQKISNSGEKIGKR